MGNYAASRNIALNPWIYTKLEPFAACWRTKVFGISAGIWKSSPVFKHTFFQTRSRALWSQARGEAAQKCAFREELRVLFHGFPGVIVFAELHLKANERSV